MSVTIKVRIGFRFARATLPLSTRDMLLLRDDVDQSALNVDLLHDRLALKSACHLCFSGFNGVILGAISCDHNPRFDLSVHLYRYLDLVSLCLIRIEGRPLLIVEEAIMSEHLLPQLFSDMRRYRSE